MAPALTYRFRGLRRFVPRELTDSWSPSNRCVGSSLRELEWRRHRSGVQMWEAELISERRARENLETRRRREAERRERVFNDKLRTMGVDKAALDQQLQEKRRQEEEEKRQQNAYDADVQQYNRAALLIQRRQQKEKRLMEKATSWCQNQQPQSRRRFEPKDPDPAEMVLPGLVGEDPERTRRQQRQKEQLRDWLFQQLDEQEEDRKQQQMEEVDYEQSTAETENKVQELQKLETERRKAAAIATTNYNRAMVEEKRQQERERSGEDCRRSAVGVPGLCQSPDRRPPPETPQQVLQVQRAQVEEKKRIELEKKREDEFYDRIRLDSARKALLMDRQQARLSKQLRRHLDSFNVQLSQTNAQQTPDLRRGHIEDSFFSKFNTCSR